METITIFSFEVCSPQDPTNPFYWRHLNMYIYTIYVSMKLSLWGGGGGGRCSPDRGTLVFKRDWKQNDLKTCTNDAHA